jgi:hypothetical protein
VPEHWAILPGLSALSLNEIEGGQCPGGLRAAQQRPAAVLVKPTNQRDAMTVFRMAAVTCADVPERRLLASSSS